MSISFKVTGVLMHRYMYNAVKYWKYLVLSFETFFKLQVFVPKRMCEEIKAYGASTSLIEPAVFLSAFGSVWGREKKREGGRGQQTWHVYVLSDLELR